MLISSSFSAPGVCGGTEATTGQLHVKGYLTIRQPAESTLTLIGFYSGLLPSNRDSLPRGNSGGSCAAPTCFPLCSSVWVSGCVRMCVCMCDLSFPTAPYCNHEFLGKSSEERAEQSCGCFFGFLLKRHIQPSCLPKARSEMTLRHSDFSVTWEKSVWTFTLCPRVLVPYSEQAFSFALIPFQSFIPRLLFVPLRKCRTLICDSISLTVQQHFKSKYALWAHMAHSCNIVFNQLLKLPAYICSVSPRSLEAGKNEIMREMSGCLSVVCVMWEMGVHSQPLSSS